MPTYEYKRKDGSTFEIRQGINDEPLTECPDTGQPVKRIITGGGGVVYKGDGWYVTDYKDNDRKKKAQKEKEKSGEKAENDQKPVGSGTAKKGQVD